MSEIYGGSSSYKSVALLLNGITWYYLVKRVIDILISIVLLILFSPIMAIAAILIKLDTSGSILFIQKRVGARRVFKDGLWIWEAVEFDFLKFRTMVHNADPTLHKAYVTALIQNNQEMMDELQQCNHPVRKLVYDPRITRTGRFLRKYSLDELPQIFNVLSGEMSLVGPRPAIKYEVDLYQPWHRGRLNTKPGITGLQQVTARCTGSFDDQVKYDLEYIQNKSIWLDLKIIAMTPIAILRHQGAY